MKDVPRYQLTAVTLEHTCGAEHIHIAREDPELAFKYGRPWVPCRGLRPLDARLNR